MKISLKFLFVICSIQLILLSSTWAQVSVTGIVTDASINEPLIGATVVIKGSSKGTITSIDGDYTLSGVATTDTLVYSFIGYLSTEVMVNGQSSIDVLLKPDTENIDEVVVIGYGTQKKSHLTGSVAKLSSDGLNQIPVSRADQALQGKMAGLSIKNISGDVGSAPEIRVRGMGSISADNSPLIVVDGYPVPDDLSAIDMADVESIEVLKDAASAAIYGSRGSNGVILITTKSGKKSTPVYKFTMYAGLKDAYKKHDIVEASEWTDIERDIRQKNEIWAASVEGRDPETIPYSGRETTIRYIGDNTDWQDEALRTGSIQNYQLSVSQGSESIRYYLSGSYLKDKGLFKDNDYDKFNMRAKIDGDLSKRVKVGINLNPSYSKQRRSSLGLHDFARTYSWLPVKHNQLTSDLTGYDVGEYAHPRDFNDVHLTDEEGNPLYDSDGNARYDDLWSSSNNNPASRRDNRYRYNSKYRIYGNSYLSINILDGLDFKTTFGGYLNYSMEEDFRNSEGDKSGIPYTVFGSELTTDLLSESFFTYNKSFGLHDLNVLGGFSAQKNSYYPVRILGQNHPTDYIQTLNAATEISQDTDETYSYIGETALLSYISRIGYAYANKYLLSVSSRWDGSSLFGPENRWAWFPSASLGWRLSEEGFLQDVAAVEELKIRTSYGVSGNNDIENYAHINTLTTTNYIFGSGQGSLAPGLGQTDPTLANRAITWEQTYEYNTGIDASFYRDRLTLSLDYYYAVTNQLLLEERIPYHSGFQMEWSNVGKVRNKGLEVELGAHVISKGDFSWEISGNFSTNDNKLIDFGGQPYEISEGYKGHKYIARVGEEAIQFFGYETDGVWLSQEDIDNSPHKAEDVPGGLKIVDKNNDGVINDEDRTVIGSPFADFNWGISNSLSWRQFDLNFLFQGVQGNEVYNADGYYFEMKRLNTEFIEGRYVNEMFPGDGQTPIVSPGTDRMLTDYLIEDGSFIALRDVMIGYTLPRATAQKIKLNGLRIYASGSNLFYFMANGYRGINPESVDTGSNYDSPLKTGAQRGAQPIARTIVFGIDLTF